MRSSTKFDITPTEQQLADYPRQMEFVPSSTEAPRVLTREQLEQFNRDGFLTPLPVFSAAEIARHREYFDALLAETLRNGGDSYSISTAHLRYGRVYDLLCEARIVDYVSDLLGPDVIGWGSHYFCKMPGDGKAVDWHQDANYWPLSPTRTVTVWLAIDDADPSNGAMQVIAGSHRFGAIEHSPASSDSVLDRAIADPLKFGQRVPISLRAGQVSLHADLLLHGSEANQSARRRCGLTLRYCTPEVRAGMDWQKKGVVVRGQDRSGHWANPPRPGDDAGST